MTAPHDIASVPWDRRVLTAWIEQAVDNGDYEKIPAAGAAPGPAIDLPRLQTLRDNLQVPGPLVAEQEALANYLWSYFSRQDIYQKVRPPLPRPAEPRVPALWTSIESAEHGPFPIEDTVMDKLPSALRITGPVESLRGFNERELDTQLRRLLNKALDWAKKDAEHPWGHAKISEFKNSYYRKPLPWASSPEFRQQAIELLQRAYLSSRHVSGREATRDTLFAQQIVEWLESFSSSSVPEPAPNLVIAVPEDLICQMPAEKPPVLSETELLQIEELIEDLSLIEESAPNMQVKELFIELESWWGENAGTNPTALPRRFGEVVALVLDWKTSSLLVSSPKTVAAEKIDYQVLSEAADILKLRLAVNEGSVLATLRQWGDYRLNEFLNFYLIELENFKNTQPSPQQWVEWVARYPDLTAIVLVVSGQGQHPQAQAILRLINQEIPAWTLYVLSRVQHSAFGIEVWAAELAVRQHSKLFVEPYDLRQPIDRQRRAQHLLQDPALSAAFEAAGIPTAEALARLEQAIEELGNWPSPTDEIFLSLSLAGLQAGEPEQLGNLIAIIDLQTSIDWLLGKANLTQAEWRELKNAFKERHRPNRWTEQHNQQLARVLEQFGKYYPAIVQGELATFLQKILSYLQTTSGTLTEDVRGKAEDADTRLRQAFLREIEVIRKVKIARLQTAWEAYSQLRGDAVKLQQKQRRAHEFVSCLRELYQVKAEESERSPFEKWLFEAADKEDFVGELKGLLGQPNIESEAIQHAVRLAQMKQSIDSTHRSGIAETHPSSISDYRITREPSQLRQVRRSRLERISAVTEEFAKRDARREHFIDRARVRGRQIIEARRPMSVGR